MFYHQIETRPGKSAQISLFGFVLGALCIFPSCIKITNSFNAIPPGMWRATLELSIDSADIAEEHTKGILPFNFEVVYVTPDSFHVVIQNSTERIVCTDIEFGLDRQIGRDTIKITLPAFGTYFTGYYEEDAIQGFWWDPSRGSQYRVPFKAYHGREYRFALNAEASYNNFSGNWKALFSVETPNPESAVLVLNQQEKHVTGTILTETGDYRFLEGNVENERMYLSTFDGSHAYLFEAKLLPDSTLSGVYRSGNHYKTYWTATRDANFKLSDPYSLTGLKDASKPFTFRFPNIKGDTISLNDVRYTDKPKIVTIFGTWCPNCLDENAFLSDYVKKHPDPGVEIISIAFERQPDPVKALQAIRNYQAHFQIPWEMLYGGSSNKQHVAASFPMLENFISFPTMLFLDKDNRVIKIHTGFYGPATDKYIGFKEEFENTVRILSSAKSSE